MAENSDPVPETGGGSAPFLLRLRVWARRWRLSHKLAFLLAGAALISVVMTVLAMTQTTSGSGPDPDRVLKLLYLDVVLLVALGAVVLRRVTALWLERRKGGAGAGLHIRFVVLFSLIAVVPTLVVFGFSAFFLNFGLQAWFSDRVATAITESVEVARAYRDEHRLSIRADTLAMANDLNRDAPDLVRSQRYFHQVLDNQAAVRGLTEAIVIDGNGRILARSRYSFAIEMEIQTLLSSLGPDKEIAIVNSVYDDRVRAIVRLSRFVDAFLIVGRVVDARVLDHIAKAEGASSEYQALNKRREGIQITFVAIFTVVALIILLAAVWGGMLLATRLAEPLGLLITAAEKVREGDLDVHVEAETRTSDEISMLGRAFNRMTTQLAAQREGLVQANRELDERNRFTETVLTGVSAGVIGLDDAGCIYLPNRSASDLLDTDLAAMRGRPLADAVPEMAHLLRQCQERPDRAHRETLKVNRHDRLVTLRVTVQAELLDGKVFGFVVTFDDITELLAAQRTAAWADVARRIAHEIKNPLTPIQLSAERLKRKYLREIQSDTVTFEKLTDTIQRQVDDIGRMVDEFSSFARMPEPAFANDNLSELCRQAVFLESNRNPAITFETRLPEQDVTIQCDARQLNRVLTNLLKNAAEGIEGRDDISQDGVIRLTLETSEQEQEVEGRVRIVIEDNGRGFPQEHRDRLTEPYVTTREKGTGLGLAIVKKIMEDHDGDLILEDRREGGARVVLDFAISPDPDRKGPIKPPNAEATG